MLHCGSRLLAMAAIVASLFYWPVGLAVVLSCAFIGVPAEAVIGFGGALGMFSGMLAWWLVAFALVLPYVVCVFPWNAETDGFRGSY